MSNLAMAVGMDNNGLMTPVVYNAENESSELVVAL